MDDVRVVRSKLDRWTVFYAVRVGKATITTFDIEQLAKKTSDAVRRALKKAVDDARRQALDDAIAEVGRCSGMTLRQIADRLEQLEEVNDD